MRTIRTVAGLRAALSEPRRGETIGLVPTMGALHEGHLSLIRRSRAECDAVVVSLFVNPAQFDESGDLRAYPRDEERDAVLAADAGADVLFAPPVEEIYPPGFSTTVSVAGVSEVLEGVHRGPGHFDGVTTIVAKLFNIVSPQVAYFGQKDAQQALVIRRMVRDLDIPVRIEVCPIVRDPDGLALSSRNARLAESDRERATALHRALDAARAAVADGQCDVAAARAQALAVLQKAGLDPDYLELVNPDDLAPLKRIDGEVLAVVAARVGDTRLIDNELIQTAAAAGTIGPMPEGGRETGKYGPFLDHHAVEEAVGTAAAAATTNNGRP
jgi:pantoate--beta-alanine ligase